LWLLIGLILIGRAVKFVWEERRLRRSGIREIDLMDGPTFERRLVALFRGLGYRVDPIGSVRGDYGGDLILSKDGKRSVVQAKCWSKNVGVKAVQEAVGARGFYKADAAIVVTNRSFTVQARKLARANDVQLWERSTLVQSLLQNRAKPSRVTALPSVSALLTPRAAEDTTGDGRGTAALCALCGQPVSERVRDYCLSRRERFAGMVYCYEHQRTN
jgi:restriction system protein